MRVYVHVCSVYMCMCGLCVCVCVVCISVRIDIRQVASSDRVERAVGLYACILSLGLRPDLLATNAEQNTAEQLSGAEHSRTQQHKSTAEQQNS